MKENFEPDMQVEDSEEFRGNSEAALGFKGIVLEQFRRCCVESSKEMTSAGVKTSISNGNVSQIDVPDQREIFINTIKALFDLLYPYLSKDISISKEIDIINKKIKDTEDSFSIEYESLVDKYSHDQDWNDTLNIFEARYYKQLMFNYRLLFRQLSLLLHSLNYFSEGGVIGG